MDGSELDGRCSDRGGVLPSRVRGSTPEPGHTRPAARDRDDRLLQPDRDDRRGRPTRAACARSGQTNQGRPDACDLSARRGLGDGRPRTGSIDGTGPGGTGRDAAPAELPPADAARERVAPHGAHRRSLRGRRPAWSVWTASHTHPPTSISSRPSMRPSSYIDSVDHRPASRSPRLRLRPSRRTSRCAISTISRAAPHRSSNRCHSTRWSNCSAPSSRL